MRKILALILLVPLIAVAQAKPTSSSPLLAPDHSEAEAGTLAAQLLTRYHYEALPLDDAMSGKIFTAYFKALDSEKLFFTQADIKRFASARQNLDDAIWDGNLKTPFAIFNLYEQRVTDRTASARKLLKKGFDFSKDESYRYDRDEDAWAADSAALDEIWRKRVKNDWLRLKLANKKDADIRSTLDKRYANYLSRVRELDGQDVFQTFMNAYANSVDPHTDYLGPRASENFDIAMKLSLEGIGAVLERRDEYTQIREIVPGGPASNSGRIKVGDRIVGVAQGSDGAMTDVVGWRLDDVVDKIRGPKDTTVRLEILPAETGPDGKHENVTLVRKKVSIEEQAAKKKIIDVKDSDGNARRIGVIDLPTFYQDFAAHRRGDANYKSATRDVAKLLGELKQAKVDGVVVDLRNNGGGSLSEATELTGLFIDKGPVVQVKDARGNVEEQNDEDTGMAWTGPLAVLVNRGSASASEIFAAAIQDYGRGLIIGAPTFGKGTVQNLIDLDHVAQNEKPTFGELKMTIAQFFRVDGGSTQLRGVTPDIQFPHSISEEDFGESSYDNALPWTSISPAHYKPVADLKPLVAPLEQRHDARVAKNADWKLFTADLAQYRKLRDRTTVSLNETRRRTQRDQMEARRKQLREAAEANRKKADDKGGDGSPLVRGLPHQDDGLQAGERSLKKELAQEKADDKAEDVLLTEAAHIVADEVDLVMGDAKLAARVLPHKSPADID